MGNITLNKDYIQLLLDYIRENMPDQANKEKKNSKKELSDEEAIALALANTITEKSSKTSSNDSVKKHRLAAKFTNKAASNVETETLEWIADGLAAYNKTLTENYLPQCDKNTTANAIQDYLRQIPASPTNYDILPKNNMDADSKKKLKETRAKYLFGEDIENGVTPAVLLQLKNDWPCLPFRKAGNQILARLKNFADEVVNKSLEHPLYRYLYSNMKKNGDEARVLLQHSVRFRAHGYEVDVRPPVGATVEWIHSALRETVCPKRAYTETDFLIVAGYLANLASQDINHAVTITDDDSKNFATISGLSADAVETIKNDICNETETVQWTIVQNSVRKFKIRLYRVVFSALALAREKNFSAAKKSDVVKNLYDAIFTKIPSTKDGDHVNIENQFDDIVMYATALILSLNADLADALISKICDAANDYRVENRDKQIGLLYILSYLLCENVSMTSQQRANVFKAAYSRTIYKLQQTEFYRIFDTSHFYQEEIQRSLKNACTFNDEKTKTLGQAEYIFLYHTVDPEDARNETETGRKFLKKACTYRSASWHDERAKEEHSTITPDDIKTALTALKNPESKENAMYYAYGMQMLGYAYANEMAKSKDNNTDLRNAVNQNRIDFLAALILADYYCRLYNPLYLETEMNKPDLFLSCGAFRAICTGEFKTITLGEKVFDKPQETAAVKKKVKSVKTKPDNGSTEPETETEKICSQYMSWFKNEYGRYQFLLGRLLLHLPITEENREEIYTVLREKLDVSEPKFLKYDNISIATLKSNSYNSDPQIFLDALK